MSLNRVVTDIMMNFSNPFSPEYFRFVVECRGEKRKKYVYFVEMYAKRVFIFSNNSCRAIRYVKKRGKLVVTQDK